MLDTKLVLAQITGLLKGLLVSTVPDVTKVVADFLLGHESRLKVIAAGATSGELNADDVKAALTTESDILYSELKTFAQIGEQLGQDTLNQVQELIYNTLQNSTVK